MFDIVFLGTAAAVPSAERGLPALLVAKGSSRYLIDCGEGTQQQLMRAGLGFGAWRTCYCRMLISIMCWAWRASSLRLRFIA